MDLKNKLHSVHATMKTQSKCKGDIKTNVAQLNQFNHFDNSSINYECIN